MLKKILFFSSITLLVACAIKKNWQQTILDDAMTIQSEAKTIGEQATLVLEELVQQANSIQIQGRQLMDTEMNFIDAVNNLKGELQNWQFNQPVLPTNIESIQLKDKKDLLAAQEAWKEEIMELKNKMEAL